MINAVLLASATGALAYLLIFLRKPPSPLRMVVKTSAMVLLALAADFAGAPGLLVTALLFCAAGDAFLAREVEKGFLPGLASFLIGHLLYLVLFWQVADSGQALLDPSLRLALAAIILLLAAGMFFWLRSALGRLLIPVALYILAILGMGLTALILPNGYGPTILGACLFILSDAILAAEIFKMRADAAARRLTAPAIWIFYAGGQGLIVWPFLNLV